MIENKWLTTTRECEALLVPTAVPVTIPPMTEVQVVQALGGHVTVNIRGNLARIDRNDVDALGLDLEALEQAPPSEPQEVNGPVDESIVWAQLKTCYDPEIPVNVVDLGLIYECKSHELKNGDELIGNKVVIKMTLTAPGCGMGPVIMADVEAKVKEVPNVTDVYVELVFEPPWDREMMSESARLELGMF